MEEIESNLCDLIISKQVSAKIDRPAGIIHMVIRKNEEEVLDDWVHDVNKVLDLIDNTANLIQREGEQVR